MIFVLFTYTVNNKAAPTVDKRHE